MFLEYNDVSLKCLDLQRYSRRSVYSPDGADLLYVRTVLGVMATYAPGGYPRMPSVTNIGGDTENVMGGRDNTVQILTQLPRGTPDPTGGRSGTVDTVPTLESDLPGSQRLAGPFFSGPQTDVELRNRLLMPRKKLILWAYDKRDGKAVRWLESPRSTMSTDATNGPIPISCDVVSAAGEPNSVGVFFQVQTDVSPCPIGSDRAVLSHRWEMSHTADENFYLTRIIRGEIIFNGAYINTFSVNPDSLRNQFIHPIPVGFSRGIPQVSQSADGLTIRYIVTDTDPTIMFSPGDSGATQIQILEKIALYKPWANWNL